MALKDSDDYDLIGNHRPLSDKASTYIMGILGNKSHTAAAKDAGYVLPANPLKDNPKVQATIESGKEAIAQALGITPMKIIAEYAKIAFFDPRKTVDPSGNPIPLHMLDELTAGAISGIDVSSTDAGGNITSKVLKYKIQDKKAALDVLAKYFGMMQDRLELTGANGGAIQTEMTDNEVARRIALVLNRAMRERVVN